jgi:uncharacterized protein with FMN-binding domain
LRRVILAVLGTAAGLVLLLSFKTHASSGLITSTPVPNGTGTSPTQAPVASGSAGTGSGAGSGGSPAGGKPGAKSGSSGGSSTASTAARTVPGDVEQTIYGPLQVTITVKSGKITAVSVPEYPNGTFRDVQINQFALPQLIQETVAANSASIDSVSGATYTSQGYISSLQSAIDKAGL